MFRQNQLVLARKNPGNNKKRYGAPGAPTITLKTDWRLKNHWRWYDMVVTYPHTRHHNERLIHYLGKHVPHPQKSLWSPDTPQPMDKHMFKLTSLDMDAFKYYFGVQRAQMNKEAWKVLWRSGLLPPTWYQKNPLIPAPIFDKEQLFKYYVKNRKPVQAIKEQEHFDYMNSMVRTSEEKARDRPKAPWF